MEYNARTADKRPGVPTVKCGVHTGVAIGTIARSDCRITQPTTSLRSETRYLPRPLVECRTRFKAQTVGRASTDWIAS